MSRTDDEILNEWLKRTPSYFPDTAAGRAIARKTMAFAFYRLSVRARELGERISKEMGFRP